MLLDEHDDDAVVLPQIALHQVFPHQVRRRLYAAFLHLQVQVAVRDRDVDEVDHRGADQHVRHPLAADQVGRNHPVGPRALELDLVLFVRRAGEDEYVGPEALCRQGYEHVVRVGADGGHDALGAHDARVDEGAVDGGVKGEVEHPVGLHALDGRRAGSRSPRIPCRVPAARRIPGCRSCRSRR